MTSIHENREIVRENNTIKLDKNNYELISAYYAPSTFDINNINEKYSVTDVVNNLINKDEIINVDNNTFTDCCPGTEKALFLKYKTFTIKNNKKKYVELFPVFYEKESSWEVDLVRSVIFKNMPIQFVQTSCKNMRNIEYFKNMKNIENYKNNCAYAFSTAGIENHEFDDDLMKNNVCKVIDYLQPKIVFIMSDEYASCNVLNQIAYKVPLVLRNYYHENYIREKNIIQVPSPAWINKWPFLTHIDYNKVKLPKNREYLWCFMGSLNKSDRYEMIDTLSNIKLCTCKYSKASYVVKNWRGSDFEIMQDLWETYGNSVFSPSGRGNYTIECVRIYESIMAGSIPIIVASEKEAQTCFKGLSNPPFIRADNWKQARDIMKNYANNEKLLEKKQKELICWWNDMILNIQNAVKNTLNIE